MSRVKCPILKVKALQAQPLIVKWELPEKQEQQIVDAI
jgi:hypothetical protein